MSRGYLTRWAPWSIKALAENFFAGFGPAGVAATRLQPRVPNKET